MTTKRLLKEIARLEELKADSAMTDKTERAHVFRNGRSEPLYPNIPKMVRKNYAIPKIRMPKKNHEIIELLDSDHIFIKLVGISEPVLRTGKRGSTGLPNAKSQ